MIKKLVICGGCLMFGAAAFAAEDVAPSRLTFEPQTVYAPISPDSQGPQENQGAVHLDLAVRYMSDYVYRGVDRSEVGGKEDAPNLQFEGSLKFDLGSLHPFVGVFANVYDSDPDSRFQEIRPYFGVELDARPLTIALGNTTYIYPERDGFGTGEVWGRITLDDSGLFGSERPVFEPYVLAAYDYDVNDGWYLEAGVRHEMPIEQTPITLVFQAAVAYTQGYQQQFIFRSPSATGFQHYEVGMTVNYELNTLLNVSRRYGVWTLQGYLFYTDKIDSDVLADTQLWGGAGLRLQY